MTDASTGSPLLRRLGRVLRVLRDTWLVFGAALLLFLIMEAGYRGQLAIKGALRGGDDGGVPPLHPYHGQQWFAEFQSAGPREDRFDAYRGYWSQPYASRYKNVDSAGRRITIQPPFDSATALRVFMLGGSTLFGFNARDSTTIASLTAARLAARGVTNVEVVNLGQGGYNVTQEAISKGVFRQKRDLSGKNPNIKDSPSRGSLPPTMRLNTRGRSMPGPTRSCRTRRRLICLSSSAPAMPDFRTATP